MPKTKFKSLDFFYLLIKKSIDISPNFLKFEYVRLTSNKFSNLTFMVNGALCSLIYIFFYILIFSILSGLNQSFKNSSILFFVYWFRELFYYSILIFPLMLWALSISYFIRNRTDWNLYKFIHTLLFFLIINGIFFCIFFVNPDLSQLSLALYIILLLYFSLPLIYYSIIHGEHRNLFYRTIYPRLSYKMDKRYFKKTYDNFKKIVNDYPSIQIYPIENIIKNKKKENKNTEIVLSRPYHEKRRYVNNFEDLLKEIFYSSLIKDYRILVPNNLKININLEFENFTYCYAEGDLFYINEVFDTFWEYISIISLYGKNKQDLFNHLDEIVDILLNGKTSFDLFEKIKPIRVLMSSEEYLIIKDIRKRQEIYSQLRNFKKGIWIAISISFLFYFLDKIDDFILRTLDLVL